MWDDTFRAELYPNGDAPMTAINGMPLKNLRPNKIFWFGTNSNGQDLWANIWQGTRNSLFIGFTTAIIEAVIGIMVFVVLAAIAGLLIRQVGGAKK